MATAKLIEKRFGQPTRDVTNPEATSIATTVTQVFKNNPDRVFWIVVNLSANDAFLAFDREVTSTRGIKLSAGGGAVSLVVDDDGSLVTREVFGIASGGAASIFSVEVELT